MTYIKNYDNIKKWITSSEEEYNTSKILLDSKDYHNAVSHFQLSVEKLNKAWFLITGRAEIRNDKLKDNFLQDFNTEDKYKLIDHDTSKIGYNVHKIIRDAKKLPKKIRENSSKILDERKEFEKKQYTDEGMDNILFSMAVDSINYSKLNDSNRYFTNPSKFLHSLYKNDMDFKLSIDKLKILGFENGLDFLIYMFYEYEKIDIITQKLSIISKPHINKKYPDPSGTPKEKYNENLPLVKKLGSLLHFLKKITNTTDTFLFFLELLKKQEYSLYKIIINNLFNKARRFKSYEFH